MALTLKNWLLIPLEANLVFPWSKVRLSSVQSKTLDLILAECHGQLTDLVDDTLAEVVARRR